MLLKVISSHFVCEEYRLTTSLLLPFLFLSLLCLCVGQYERFIFCVPAPFGCHICLKSLIRAFKHLIINSLLFRLLLGLSLASLSLHQKKMLLEFFVFHLIFPVTNFKCPGPSPPDQILSLGIPACSVSPSLSKPRCKTQSPLACTYSLIPVLKPASESTSLFYHNNFQYIILKK